jgi:Tol biopolymer transport system component
MVRSLMVPLVPVTLVLAGGLGAFLAADAGFGEPRGESLSAAFPGKPGQLSFFRDGNRRGIYVSDPSGKNVERITQGYDVGPTWAPDGRRIAFARGDRKSLISDDYKGIYVVNADGSGLREVLKSPVSGSLKPMRKLALPTWSPDGTQLAFQHENGIGVVNLDGTGARSLLRSQGGGEAKEPAWSPDGKTLAFSGADVSDGISVVDVTSGQQRRVTRGCNASPDWSPDGQKLACWRISLLLGKRNALYVADVASGAVQRVTKKARLNRSPYAPSWSPDGLRIVFGKFTKLTSRKAKSDVYVVNSDGKRQHRLIRNAFLPDWARQP